MAKAIAAGQAVAHLVELIADEHTPGDTLDTWRFMARQLRSLTPEPWWNLIAKMDQIDRHLDQLPTYRTTRPMILTIIDARIRAAETAATDPATVDRLFAGLVD